MTVKDYEEIVNHGFRKYLKGFSFIETAIDHVGIMASYFIEMIKNLGNLVLEIGLIISLPILFFPSVYLAYIDLKKQIALYHKEKDERKAKAGHDQ